MSSISKEDLIYRNQQKILMHSRKTENGCILWEGQISNSGFGKVLLKEEDGTNKMHSVHRASYILFKNQLSKDDIVIQTCKNRLCINPNHLKITDKINDEDWIKTL